MSLVLTNELGLTEQIRARMAGGAAVWEVTGADLPDWLAAAVGTEQVAAAFVSAHAGVAVLEGGRTVVRRAPRN